MHQQLEAMASLVEAENAEQLVRRMHEIVAAEGLCDRVLFGMQVARPVLKPVRIVATNYPDSYFQLYEQKNFAAIDPVLAHCQVRSDSCLWTPDLYDDSNRQVLEESRLHGLSHGVSRGLQERSDNFSLASMARDQPFVAAELERANDLLAALIGCASIAVRRHLVSDAFAQVARERLTARELQCLRYLVDGKSNSVIAQLLSISDATVEFHLKNLYAKLGITTRYQAMAAGLSLLQDF